MTYLIFDGMSVLKSAPFNMTNVGNGVAYAFLRTVRADINKISEFFKDPVSAVVCWEGSLDHKKSEIEGYKASRSISPSTFLEGREIVKAILPTLGVMQAVHPHWEADDLVAYFSQDKERTVIRSGDHDLRQTVSENNFLLQKDLTAKKGTANRMSKLDGPPEMISLSNFYVRTGYKNPKDFLTAKVVIRDKSDELVGLDGIGKTRMETYLYDAACPPALREKIDTYLASDYAKRLKSIMQIPNANFKPEEIRYTPPARDPEAAKRLLTEAGFTNTVKDFWGWYEPFSKLD